MKKTNKLLIIIICSILTIAIIAVLILFVFKNKDKSNNNSNTNNTVSNRLISSYEVIDAKDIDNEINKAKKSTNLKVSSKYKVEDNIYESDSKVDLDQDTGKVIYVRDKDTKLNVIQIEYKIEHNEDHNEHIQVEEYLNQFLDKSKNMMDLNDLNQKPESESLSDKKKPFGEQIYLDKKEYSARYEVKDNHYTEKDIKEMELKKEDYTKTFDINIYMNGEDKLVCELVRVL